MAFPSLVCFALIASTTFAAVVVHTPEGTANSVLWDGRVPKDFTPKSFDKAGVSPYNVDYNKGQNQSWSDIISFPSTTAAASLFDRPRATKPWRLCIDDGSVFAPSPTNVQLGFRRSELMPAPNDGEDATVAGVRTLHASLRRDDARPLNYSHAYELVFLETADFSSHVFTLKTGTPRDGGGGTTVKDVTALRVEGSTAGGATGKTLFETAFVGGWHNFALQIDFDKGLLSVYYSAGQSNLKPVVKAVKNDASGRGQYHVGILKNPTGPTDDVVHSGYQPKGIDEALVYGGVFIEKGANVLGV